MRPSLMILVSAAALSGGAFTAAATAQPQDPVADLLRDEAGNPTAAEPVTGPDTSPLPDAEEEALGWQHSQDEPPPTAAEDPQVSITADLNRGVAELDQEIAAADARAEARWEGDVQSTDAYAAEQDAEYQAALAAHAEAVAAQRAAYEADMAAWARRAEDCRRGVRDACVTWYRE